MSRALHTDIGGLTAEDVRMIEHIADLMIEAGIWQRVEHCPSSNMDFFDVYEAERQDAVCGIGRYVGGRYVVVDYRSGLIALGFSLSEALTNVGYLPGGNGPE